MTQEQAVELWRTIATLPPHDLAAGWALVAFACAVEARERERCAAIVEPGALTASDARCGEEGLEMMRDFAGAIRGA